jgi:hypothetical protein
VKKYLVLLWLLLPLPVLVFHFTRGQQWLARDQARDLVARGAAAEQAADWPAADHAYREAARLTGKTDEALRLRLDLAQTRVRHRAGEPVAAIDLAGQLLADPAFAAMPEAFRREAREQAARLHYHAAWVMRLEGAGRELWMEEAEKARQNFRLLAEDAGTADESEASRRRTNLESAVQLQRLSLTELMGRPLPEEGQCMAGQGLTEQMGKRRGKRGQQPAPGPGEGDPADGAGTERFQPGQGS